MDMVQQGEHARRVGKKAGNEDEDGTNATVYDGWMPKAPRCTGVAPSRSSRGPLIHSTGASVVHTLCFGDPLDV